jgi:hypothetical protein
MRAMIRKMSKNQLIQKRHRGERWLHIAPLKIMSFGKLSWLLVRSFLLPSLNQNKLITSRITRSLSLKSSRIQWAKCSPRASRWRRKTSQKLHVGYLKFVKSRMCRTKTSSSCPFSWLNITWLRSLRMKRKQIFSCLALQLSSCRPKSLR